MIYSDFALVYDRLMEPLDYVAWANYLNGFLKGTGKESLKILEFGCGTGSITLELAKVGHDLTGVDLSPEMLTLAEEKTRGSGRVRFIEGDMSEFVARGGYDAVVSTCDAMNYLDSLESLRSTIKAAWNALDDGGVFLFDMHAPTKLTDDIAGNTFLYNLDDLYCVWESRLSEDSDYVEYWLTFFIEEDDGRYSRHEEYQREYIYTVEEVLALLAEVGFREVEVRDFGAETGLDKKGMRNQFFCKKRVDTL